MPVGWGGGTGLQLIIWIIADIDLMFFFFFFFPFPHRCPRAGLLTIGVVFLLMVLLEVDALFAVGISVGVVGTLAMHALGTARVCACVCACLCFVVG